MNVELDGLNLIDLLDLLEPVPQPPAISLTPQTPGWIVLGLGVLALLVWGLRAWRQHRRANAYRRAALVELGQTQGDATHIAALLRRTALAGFGRADVAGLTGQDWLDFLEHSYGGTGFSSGPGQVLLTAPYQGTPSDNPPDLKQLAHDWIAHHKRRAV